jgi:hypothetical protein
VLNEAGIENMLRTIDPNHERPEYDGRMKAMKALKAEIGMMASGILACGSSGQKLRLSDPEMCFYRPIRY